MIREKQPKSEIVIDLTGPEGNAFVILGYARKFAKEFGLDADMICNEMRKSDYENLISVFDKYFGDFVILER